MVASPLGGLKLYGEVAGQGHLPAGAAPSPSPRVIGWCTARIVLRHEPAGNGVGSLAGYFFTCLLASVR